MKYDYEMANRSLFFEPGQISSGGWHPSGFYSLGTSKLYHSIACFFICRVSFVDFISHCFFVVKSVPSIKYLKINALFCFILYSFQVVYTPAHQCLAETAKSNAKFHHPTTEKKRKRQYHLPTPSPGLMLVLKPQEIPPAHHTPRGRPPARPRRHRCR